MQLAPAPPPFRRHRTSRAALVPAALLAAAAIMLAACAGAPRAADAAPFAPGSPRSVPGWRSLPEPANEFALEFAARVEAGDWTWIAERADSEFAAAYGAAPGLALDGTAAARLVRAGAFADLALSENEPPGPLPIGSAMRVVFDEAALKGPVVIFYGRFIARGKKDIPFALRLIWQLDEPRILGLLD